MNERPTLVIEITGVFAAGLVFVFGFGLGVFVGLTA